MRSVICAKVRGQIGPCEWSLPTAGACPFDVVKALVLRVQIKRSSAGTPAGAAQRCHHRQHAISGLLRAIWDYLSPVRALRSFLLVPGLQAAVPDAGPLRCDSTHRHAPPCCKQPRKLTMGFAHLRRCHESCMHVVSRVFQLERSNPLETKKRGENNRNEFWYKKGVVDKNDANCTRIIS